VLAKLLKSGDIEAKIRAGAPDHVNEAVKEREALRALRKAVGDSPAGRQLVADGIMDEIDGAEDAIEEYLQSKPMDPMALRALLKSDTLKTRLQPPGAVPHSVVQYKRDIVFEGEADKFYPIVLPLPSSAAGVLKVWRNAEEQAPDSWNNGPCKGSMVLEVEALNRAWGGEPTLLDVKRYLSLHTRLLGAVRLSEPRGEAIIVWLRGGGTAGAKYHFEASFPLDGDRKGNGDDGSCFTPLYEKTKSFSHPEHEYQKYVEPITSTGGFVPLADVSYRLVSVPHRHPVSQRLIGEGTDVQAAWKGWILPGSERGKFTYAKAFRIQSKVWNQRTSEEQELLTAMGRGNVHHLLTHFDVWRIAWAPPRTKGGLLMFASMPTYNQPVTCGAFVKLEKGNVAGGWADGAEPGTWKLCGQSYTNGAWNGESGYCHPHPRLGSDSGSLLVALPALVYGTVDLQDPRNWWMFPCSFAPKHANAPDGKVLDHMRMVKDSGRDSIQVIDPCVVSIPTYAHIGTISTKNNGRFGGFE
jgi:hypothetical protein